MRVLLQTLDHGMQYRLAHSMLLEAKKTRVDIKIVELKSTDIKKTLFEKIQYYRKRGKLKSLCVNVIGRAFNRRASLAFSRKSELIDQILLKKCKLPSEELIDRVDCLDGVHSIIKQWKPDVVLVIGAPYLPKSYFIEGIAYINLHIGKIPKYRGLKCIEWALIDKDSSSIGYTVHKLTSRLDFGGIYYYENVNAKNKTLSEIYAECYILGIKKAIGVALDKNRQVGLYPDNAKEIRYSIDFNSFAVKKVLENIEI